MKAPVQLRKGIAKKKKAQYDGLSSYLELE